MPFLAQTIPIYALSVAYTFDGCHYFLYGVWPCKDIKKHVKYQRGKACCYYGFLVNYDLIRLAKLIAFVEYRMEFLTFDGISLNVERLISMAMCNINGTSCWKYIPIKSHEDWSFNNFSFSIKVCWLLLSMINNNDWILHQNYEPFKTFHQNPA